MSLLESDTPRLGILSSTRHGKSHKYQPGALLKGKSGKPYVWIRPIAMGSNDWIRLDAENFAGHMSDLDIKLNCCDLHVRPVVYLEFSLNSRMIGNEKKYFAENAKVIHPTRDELILRLKEYYALTPGMAHGKNPGSMRIDGWTQREAKRALENGLMGLEEYHMGKSENGLRGPLGPAARGLRDREALVRETLKRLDQKAQDK